MKYNNQKLIESYVPKKAEPLTEDSLKEKLMSCLPPVAEEPTKKELKAFAEIMAYHPGFKSNPNGIQLLAKLYGNDDHQKTLLNTIYQTAEYIKKNSRNGA